MAHEIKLESVALDYAQALEIHMREFLRKMGIPQHIIITELGYNIADVIIRTDDAFDLRIIRGLEKLCDETYKAGWDARDRIRRVV